MPCETNMMQGSPSASHLESPDMGVQGSIHLMVSIYTRFSVCSFISVRIHFILKYSKYLVFENGGGNIK